MQIITDELDKLIIKINIDACKATIKENTELLEKLNEQLSTYEKVEGENV